jgi:predicted O-methyltransferase YrrM|tara:strand:+ start:56 stop:661 length:606 start_codon:yes stop_codon:yes gene_type:complete
LKYKNIDLSVCKRENSNTTSHKFKKDLIDVFENTKYKKNYTALEVSCHKGHTTSVLSSLFHKVYAVDVNRQHLEDAKKLLSDRTNVEFINLDVYERFSFWGPLPKVNVIFIDCAHDKSAVVSDLYQAIKHLDASKGMIILDDYGLYAGVREAVALFLEDLKDQTSIHSFIGEPKGSTARKGKIMADYEGVILNFNSIDNVN